MIDMWCLRTRLTLVLRLKLWNIAVRAGHICLYKGQDGSTFARWITEGDIQNVGILWP